MVGQLRDNTSFLNTDGDLMSLLKSMLIASHVRGFQAAAIIHHVLEDIRIGKTPSPRDIVCIVTTRNELLRLPDFLRHYRELGVGRFAVIDNESADGTLDYLLAQPDVDVFRARGSFAEAGGGIYWHARLAARYGYGRWYLAVDADELLVYSGMDRHNLHDLSDYLRRWGSRALFAPMIDMYADTSFASSKYNSGDRLLDIFRFFDGASYKVERSDHQITNLSGGPRARLLSSEQGAFENCLTKYPLFFWDRTVRRRDIHQFQAHRHKPGPSGALLHFKFLPDFEHKLERAVAERQHWNNSVQYRAYAKNLNALTSLHDAQSVEYLSPDSLVNLGLMNRIYWGSKRPTRSILGSLLTGRPLIAAFDVMERTDVARSPTKRPARSA